MRIISGSTGSALLEEIPSYVATGPGQGGRSVGLAAELWTVLEATRNAIVHYEFPISRQLENTQLRFQVLAHAWKKDVRHFSSITQIVLHPAYQRIIGMGPAVVPFVVRELEKEPDHWFWALKAITGADPVAPGNRGKISEMAKDWIRWARAQGFYT